MPTLPTIFSTLPETHYFFYLALSNSREYQSVRVHV